MREHNAFWICRSAGSIGDVRDIVGLNVLPNLFEGFSVRFDGKKVGSFGKYILCRNLFRPRSGFAIQNNHNFQCRKQINNFSQFRGLSGGDDHHLGPGVLDPEF